MFSVLVSAQPGGPFSICSLAWRPQGPLGGLPRLAAQQVRVERRPLSLSHPPTSRGQPRPTGPF